MKYNYRNIRAEFDTPEEKSCIFRINANHSGTDLCLANGVVTVGKEVSDLSKYALQEFARKCIDVNYNHLCQYMTNAIRKEDIPLSDVALKTAMKVQKAANFIVQLCCEHTTTGSLCVYDDEVAELLHTSTEDVHRLADEICAAVMDREEVAALEIIDGAFDVTCYLQYCPNYEEPQEGEEGKSEQNTIRILRVKADRAPEVAFIPNTFEDIRSEVGGGIETVTLNGVCIIVNGEGKLNGMQPNRSFGEDVFFGTFIVCGTHEDEFCSLTDEQIEQYTQMFAQPEFSQPTMAVGITGISM